MRLKGDSSSIVQCLQICYRIVVGTFPGGDSGYHSLTLLGLDAGSQVVQLLRIGEITLPADHSLKQLPESDPVQGVALEDWQLQLWQGRSMIGS